MLLFFFRTVTLWITNHVQFLITSLWYAKLNSLGVLWKGFFFVRQLRIGSISTAYSDLEYPRLPPKWVRFSYMTPNVMWVEVAVAWLSTFSKRNLYWYICFPLSSIYHAWYAEIDTENFRESMPALHSLSPLWVRGRISDYALHSISPKHGETSLQMVPDNFLILHSGFTTMFRIILESSYKGRLS